METQLWESQLWTANQTKVDAEHLGAIIKDQDFR
jgi:hypothetical protein